MTDSNFTVIPLTPHELRVLIAAVALFVVLASFTAGYLVGKP